MALCRYGNWINAVGFNQQKEGVSNIATDQTCGFCRVEMMGRMHKSGSSSTRMNFAEVGTTKKSCLAVSNIALNFRDVWTISGCICGTCGTSQEHDG